MKSIWNTLYDEACRIQNDRVFSAYIEAGEQRAPCYPQKAIFIPVSVLMPAALWESVLNAMRSFK